MNKARHVKTIINKFREEDFKEEILPNIEGIVTSCGLIGRDPTGHINGGRPKLCLYLDKPFKPIHIDDPVRVDIGEKIRVFYEDYKKDPYIDGRAIEVFDKKGKVKFRYNSWDCAFVDEE